MISVSHQQWHELLHEGQGRVIEQLYKGCSLETICDGIVSFIERMGDGIFCSVLEYEQKTETLHCLAAPNLPDFYNKAIDGMKIGDGVGACGTAAFRKTRVITSDILEHPYWARARKLVKKTQLRSCWSQPIFDYDNRLLGTFAIYYDRPGEPGEFESDVIVSAARLVALAMIHKNSETQRKNLENRLYQTQKMEAIGTLAGGIAHDFNNLLSILNANMEILKVKLGDNEDQSVHIQHSQETIFRATELVKRILSFSRQEQTKLTPINLVPVLESSLVLLSSTIPKTVDIQVHIGEKSIIGNADTVQLQQIIVNLCTNAVHAMNGKGVLTVNLEKVRGVEGGKPSNNNMLTEWYAKLEITDTGSGMDKLTLDRIFEPFFTTKGVGEGTGMGLPMVYGLVEQHGGEIKVDSKLGVGTTFSVYFPLTDKACVVSENKTVLDYQSGGEHILFVDDEELLCMSGSEMLELQGYRVTCVMDSADAFEIFKKNPKDFDLVITDQMMPKMSGIELIRKLLSVRADIPIILCSGYSSMTTESEVLNMGAKAFCMKPVNMEMLCSTVRQVLDIK